MFFIFSFFFWLASSVGALPTVEWSSMDPVVIRSALTEVGALRVTNVPGLAEARQIFADPIFQNCLEEEGRPGGDKSSVGLLSVGGSAPPRVFENAACPDVKTLRAIVSSTSLSLFAAIDATTKVKFDHYDSLTRFMHSGEHLEQFHAFAPSSSMDMHVDAGLVIAMVGEYGSKAKLRVQLPPKEGGMVIECDADDGIIFVVGDGMTRFFDLNVPFRPAPHAVEVASERRFFYGKMFLPPADAMIQGKTPWNQYREDLRQKTLLSSSSQSSTFLASFQQQQQEEEEDQVVGVGCGRVLSTNTELCRTQDGEEGLFCWAQCIPIPEECTGGVECVDYSTGKVLDGNVHCASHSFDDCGPRCIDAPAENATFKFEADSGFCVGDGVTMYMDGFRSIFEKNAPACVNFWNTKWTLKTRFRFGWAIVAAFFVGALVEALIFLRRSLFRIRMMRSQLLLVVLHFFQSVLGYLAMFLAMTYNVELFVAVCLGATAGHVAFNLKQQPTASDPCCAAAHQSETLTANSHVVFASTQQRGKQRKGEGGEKVNCCARDDRLDHLDDDKEAALGGFASEDDEAKGCCGCDDDPTATTRLNFSVDEGSLASQQDQLHNNNNSHSQEENL